MLLLSSTMSLTCCHLIDRIFCEMFHVDYKWKMINSLSSHQCRVAWWSGFFGHVWLAVSPPEVSGHTNRPFRVWRISALHLNDTGTVRCLRKRSKWEDFQGWVPPPFFLTHISGLSLCPQWVWRWTPDYKVSAVCFVSSLRFHVCLTASWLGPGKYSSLFWK